MKPKIKLRRTSRITTRFNVCSVCAIVNFYSKLHVYLNDPLLSINHKKFVTHVGVLIKKTCEGMLIHNQKIRMSDNKMISISTLRDVIDSVNMARVESYIQTLEHTMETEGMTMPFGKHSGVPISDLVVTEPKYCKWLLRQAWLAEDQSDIYDELMKYKFVLNV